MHLNVNPYFFSQLLDRVRYTVREFVANVSSSWPQDVKSAIREIVVDIHTSNSDRLTPSVHNNLVKRGCDALTVWAPPISFEPPPLPPPPPIDPLFSASDMFRTATFIPLIDEVDVPFDWPRSSLAAYGLLGFGILFLIAVSVWTFQGFSFDTLIDQRYSEQSGPLQTGFDTVLSVVKLSSHHLVSTLQYTVRNGRQLPRRVLLSSIRATRLFFESSIQIGRYIGVKFITVILPSVIDISLRLFVWLFHRVHKAFNGTAPPTPVLQPEKTADNPQPAPPPRPPPPPTPPPAQWYALLLDGDTKVGPHQKNIIEGERIGKGGFAEVFRGLNKATGEALAIKRVKKKALGENGQHLILGEIRAMNRIRDTEQEQPFPKLFGSYMDESDYILVMNLFPGTMEAKLRAMDGYFDRPLAYFYGAQLLLAIHSLHKLGIIHCDIKPDNIFIDSRGDVVLADFGIAKVFDPKAEGGEFWNGYKELGGDFFPLLLPMPDDNPHLLDEVRGTDFYAAPETSTQSYSYGVDYWSWAATFFQFLTGVLPLVIDGRTEEYVEPMEVSLGYNRFRKTTLTNVENDFFSKAFDMNPFERWATVHEIKAEPIWQGFDWYALSQGTLLNPLHQPVVKTAISGGRVGRTQRNIN
ncbi:kinase-like domain-containing protein [Roridomyces roridus]|uniref:non-specific serine/threonine protein kinase n=1 Tax=Roridomyces roridus TaxID=1738132 RepID=A0AAD7B603_9AGAR|nr:kinase-like domain-containing protein [Roridomyces roridus]